MLVDGAVSHSLFPFMDSLNDYNQIKLDLRKAEKTAFWTLMGNFHYTVTLVRSQGCELPTYGNCVIVWRTMLVTCLKSKVYVHHVVI